MTFDSFLSNRSIVILDNWSVHHAIEDELMTALNSKGALLIWNPPSSLVCLRNFIASLLIHSFQDLNPNEKLWDVTLMKMQQRHQSLDLGLDGPICPFVYPDFLDCLFEARLNHFNIIDDLQRKVE